MNVNEFDIDGKSFELIFEAYDSLKNPISGSRITLDDKSSKDFIQRSAHDFFDTSIIIYKSLIDGQQSINCTNRVSDCRDLDWDNLKDNNTEYNKAILDHYAELSMGSLTPITEWLEKHIDSRWSICGQSTEVDEFERIILSNHISNLSDVIKNCDLE